MIVQPCSPTQVIMPKTPALGERSDTAGTLIA